MFKHAFHGGPAVEVLTVSGKNPLEKWKTTGTIGKPFESTMKGYIFTLDGQSKIQVPKDEKESLGLIQPFLVLQIFIPLGKNLHIEVGITDSSKTRRRLIFHSGAKEIVANPLHARIPITQFRRNQWMNLCLDIASFTHNCFKSVNFRSIDFLEITASCKLRRIFTMKNPLYDDQSDEELELAQLINLMMAEEQRENMQFEYTPNNLSFPQGFTNFNQFMFPHRLRMSSSKTNADENINNQNSGAENSTASGAKKDGKFQVAFGQRVGNKNVVSQNSNRGGIQNDSKGLQINSAVKKPLQNEPQIKSNRLMSGRQQISSQKSGNRTNQNNQQQLNQDLDDYEEEKFPNDNEIQDEETDYSWKRQDEKPKKQIIKEDLKEQEHFLYLQNDSDNEEDTDQPTQQIKTQSIIPKSTKNKLSNNPWDEKITDKQPRSKLPQNSINKVAKNNFAQSPGDSLISTSQQDKSISKQVKFNDIQPEKQSSNLLNSKLQTSQQQQNLENRKQIVFNLDEDEDSSEERHIIQNTNPYEYTREIMQLNSPSMNEYEKQLLQKKQVKQKTTNNFNNRPKLKRDDEEEDVMGFNQKANSSKYNNFNVDSWGQEEVESGNVNNGKDSMTHKFDILSQHKGIDDSQNFIEEQFDIHHENLLNYYNQNAQQSSAKKEQRKSKEFKENPMQYIEIEFTNDVEDIPEQIQDNDEDYQIDRRHTHDTTQSYQRLESSRKEERRPFSPPFKLPIANLNNQISAVGQDHPTSSHLQKQSVRESQRSTNQTIENQRYNRDLYNNDDSVKSNNLDENQQNSSDLLTQPRLQQQPSDASDLVKIQSFKEYQELQAQDKFQVNHLQQDEEEDQTFFDDYRKDLDGSQFNQNDLKDFNRKIEYLKVQRTEILRDSLDQTIPSQNTNKNLYSLSKFPSQAKVENEEGDIVEVMFDPILQCYYDPKTNTYYELKQQQE
eukprot:403340256